MPPSTLPTAGQFARIAAELHAAPDREATAQTIVDRLLALVVEADGVSLTVKSPTHGYATLAATDDRSRHADALQYELDEGPCLRAVEHDPVVRTGDLRHDLRWPRWGAGAADLGIGSLLAVQLTTQGGAEGALNIYSTSTGAFSSSEAIDLATIYAVHAAHALFAARLLGNLEVALSSRHTIGVAQGIAMERYDLSEDRSFAMLRRLSEATETKLRDVARHVVRTGSLVDLGRGPDRTEPVDS